ncbi:hypothetical protein [Saccharopolyspora taberi]|uniref:Uncharacterized protein n=1 Tax=Saccharopolyspora taberi TaxID=60895 RepID=A0ABN3VH70_9PSEU
MIAVLAIRRQWCGPGEPILWCAASGLDYRYDVPGLDESGNPLRGWGSRAVRGVGGAVGGGILNVVDAVMDDDGGDDHKDYPPGFLSGPAAECAAIAEYSRAAAVARHGFWVLTPHRLARLAPHVPAAEPEEPEGSWARRFGKGALKFARDVGDIVASKPEHEPGVPVPLPEIREHAVIDRRLLAGFDAHQRKLGREYTTSRAWYLRIRFTDGSAMEISPHRDEEAVRRLVAMSEGRL